MFVENISWFKITSSFKTIIRIENIHGVQRFMLIEKYMQFLYSEKRQQHDSSNHGYGNIVYSNHMVRTHPFGKHILQL